MSSVRAPLRLLLLCLGSSVIVASTGCATSKPDAASTTPAERADNAPAVALADFSESERERILAVQEIVEAAAAERQIDPSLLNAIIWVESRFDPQAKSSAGARGLMQLMPATAAYLAKRMGERAARAYDPEFNVRAGALYLSEMIAKFGDEQVAVAAYHAGPGNVKRWLEDGSEFPDYSQAYVGKVMEARVRFEDLEASATPHGRGSEVRSAAPVIVEPKPAPRETVREPGTEPEPPEDAVAPDPDSLPDAAEIHGMPRTLDENPYLDEEPVFVPHPELDKPAATEPEPEPEPAPTPKPKPAPVEPDEAGLGLLPDL